jgi:hypothetical protein
MRLRLFKIQIPILICLVILLLNLPKICLAEAPSEVLQKVLSQSAGFEDNELNALKQGEIVSKLLPVKDDREVSVCGIVKVQTPLEMTLKVFQETMSRQNKSSVTDLGDFSQTPVIGDLQTLTLDKGDIEKLKVCRVGSCDLRLSAPMIERLNKEIDWTAPDYSAQANILFRKILLEYVQDYLSRGNEALIEYNHQRNPIKLREDYDSLLNNLLWINEFAPEFSEYLKNFPRSELSNVRKTLTWSKIKFGLKPVVVVTQTLTYTTEKNGVSQILSVSKQIYASRYFDSSLGLTALIKFPEDDSYLFYTNQSRSSALEGMFSGFKRELVKVQAIEKIKPLLQNTKAYAQANLKKSVEAAETGNSQIFTGWSAGRNYWFWGILIIAFLIGLFWFGGKRVGKW